MFRQQHEQLRQAGRAEGECAYSGQMNRTAEALGCSADDVRRVVEEWMIRRPGRWLRRFRRRGLIDQLTEYRQQGGRAAVVSDYPARVKLRAMGVAELFDAVIANGEYESGLPLKPNPTGYLEAAKQLGIAADRCLVWGDRADADGAAAEAAGMGFRQV
jgi:phosphoglycolate phosphatase/putative hydrolase of the HAD superfamily